MLQNVDQGTNESDWIALCMSTAKILVNHLSLIELCGEYTSMHSVGFGCFTWSTSG